MKASIEGCDYINGRYENWEDKSMKRKIAFLLAVVLIVSAGFMAYATGSESEGAATTATQSGAQRGETEDQALPEGIRGAAVTGTVQNPETGGEAGGAAEGQNSAAPQNLSGLEEIQVPINTQELSNSTGTQTPEDTQGAAEPEGTQEPTAVQKPGNTQEPTAVQKPGNTQEPTAVQKPGNMQEPTVTQQPGSSPDVQGVSGTQPSGNAEGIPVSGGDAEARLPEEGVTGNKAEGTVPIGDIGQVDVAIGAALSFDQSINFAVKLENPAIGTKSGTITVGGISEGEGKVRFDSLPDGEYVLTVSAEGFATYTQSVRVAGKAYAIKLMTGFLKGIDYVKGIAHPGVLVLGDVAGNDGIVNAADVNAMVDAIDQRLTPDQRDLNRDGRIDLVDLEFFAKTYNVPAHIDMQAGVEQSVSRAVITPSAGAGTQVEGNLESLLEDSGSITLKQVSGEPISEEHPVAVDFEFGGVEAAAEMDGIIIASKNENPITSGAVKVTYVDENGIERLVKKTFSVDENGGITLLLQESDVTAQRDAQGNIRLSLGSQVAVKRVTLLITGMRKSNELAEITKVEFVNGMAERIPEPEMDVPKNLKAEAGSQKISLSWDPCVNVTGYEVSIRQGEYEETMMVAGNALDIVSFNRDKLTNYLEYQLKVQAVNGTWRSGYGETVTAIPTPNGPPDPPDNVNAAGQFKSIIVSWKDMDDTVSYNVYFKAKESGDNAYQKIASEIPENRFTITGLEDLTSYNVYVTGVNEIGESRPSVVALATTTDAEEAVMPRYKLINTGESGQKGAHIISAAKGGEISMVDSSLDTEAGTAWGTVDHEPASHGYAGTWDTGGYNALGNHGLKFEFDEAYMIDRFAFHDVTSRDTGYVYAQVRYWDENGVQTDVAGVSMQRLADADGRTYYLVKLPEAVKAKQIQFGIARGSASGTITISEVYFYYYDSVFDDIMALYQDDLHVVLKPDVTQSMIDDLRKRINTVDEVSGELHPDYEMLERELKNAEDILNAVNLTEPVRIHSTITAANDGGKKFGGLNAWQPLGVTAAAQDKIVVYVGHNTKKTGESTNLQLVATQYNSEASAMFKTVQTLKIGANEITVPKIWSLDYESGGALYVQYTGNKANDQYAVRVSGGVQVPILDLYKVTDEAERLAKTVEYIEKLGTYVSQIEEVHEREHYYSTNPLMKQRDFDNQTCILGATDIMLDTMMFSLPAQQIWAGSAANGTSTEERARTLLGSMDSMEKMMYLFYQHKGLNADATANVDKIPACHQNIRYQRMFAKAFMYASGNHIGIGWGSAAGMASSPSVVFDEKGRWQSGHYFGWGIAHEIGHCINQGDYAVAEITNNYFAVLAQARETNDSVRFQYSNVYEKVTSGAKGPASNVFTQLGMYWQLHLAYDNGYNYMTYENYDEQLANLFFARVDTYSRTPSKAPAPGGVALTISGDTDQKLMRLSCAAAEKNILEFFRRWGMTPDADTIAYAEQFEEETRAIYYVNDEARAYRVENGGSSLNRADGTKVDVVSDAVTAKLVDSNRIDINLSFQNIPEEDVLGYEIVRCMYSGGEVTEEPVGFATGSTCTYSDIIATVNNRTVFYKIKLVDKYLYYSAEKVLAPIKIEHDGSLDKTSWTVTTSDLTVEGETGTGSTNNLLYCDPENETTYEKDKLIDNLTETVYTATAGNAPEIVLNFNKVFTVAGFKVSGATGLSGISYEIQVCTADGIWLADSVASGTFNAEAVQTIRFANADNAYVSTYEATAVKLILKAASGSQVSVGELDVLGVTGDNVDFRRTEDSSTAVIGILEEAFQFGENAEDVIPEGSIVFAGAYKGNAAYNSVLLFDQDGNNVGKVTGTGDDMQVIADSIILADVPDKGDIANVTNGTWIYWLEPDTDVSGIEKVRAELYRVNKAETNEGQRLVSDSLFENMPDELPLVTLDRDTGLQK